MAEDRETVVLLKDGSTDALEQLIMRWRSRAEAYADSILHDSRIAEDVVQEAFSRIYAIVPFQPICLRLSGGSVLMNCESKDGFPDLRGTGICLIYRLIRQKRNTSETGNG